MLQMHRIKTKLFIKLQLENNKLINPIYKKYTPNNYINISQFLSGGLFNFEEMVKNAFLKKCIKRNFY